MSNLARQFTWISSGKIIAAILQAATLAILANLLGPAGFGIAAAVIGGLILPQSLFDFGLTTFVVRQRAIDKLDGRIPRALALSDRLSLVFGVLAVGTLALLGVVGNSEFLYLAPLGIWAASERNTEVWLGVSLGDGNVRMNTVSLLTRRAVALGGMLVLLIFDVDPALSFAAAAAGAGALGGLMAKRSVRPILPRSTDLHFSEMLREVWPYWLHSTATQVRNLDTALTAAFGTATQAGNYAVASRLTNPLRILPTSLGTVLLPEVSRTGGRINRRVATMVAAMTLGMSAIFVLGALLAPWAVPLVLGAEFEAAVRPVQIVLLGMVWGTVASLSAALLQAAGERKWVSFTSLAASLLAVPAIVIGTVQMGAVGAAIGLTVSFAVQAGAMVWRLISLEARRRSE
jgi:O-antigen/teichoic acid export membrane protein